MCSYSIDLNDNNIYVRSIEGGQAPAPDEEGVWEDDEEDDVVKDGERGPIGLEETKEVAITYD